MVHRYPAAVKAFYMEPDPKDANFALCVDVLAPEGYGEVIGGSQRVSSYELLKSRIEHHQLPLGSVPVVSRSASLRIGAPRGLRHGNRARGGVGLRAGSCAGDDSVCADAAPDLSVAIEGGLRISRFVLNKRFTVEESTDFGPNIVAMSSGVPERG